MKLFRIIGYFALVFFLIFRLSFFQVCYADDILMDIDHVYNNQTSTGNFGFDGTQSSSESAGSDGKKNDDRAAKAILIVGVAGAVAAGLLAALVSSGGSSSSSSDPTPCDQPTVTKISPDNGPIAGDTSVTITGTNFDDATGVKFGDQDAKSYTFVSSTEITAVSPAVTVAGVVHVRVTTPCGTSAESVSDRFTYNEPTKGAPVIKSSSDYNLLYFKTPLTGIGNSPVTSRIYVLNNSSEAAENGFAIKFDPEGSIEVLSGSTCSSRVEPNSECYFDLNYTGSGSATDQLDRTPVKITINEGQSNADTITVNCLDVPYGHLFDPTVDDTKAHGIDATKSVYGFATFAKNGVDFIYTATADGVFKSSDSGAHWVRVNNNLTTKDARAICTNEQSLYVGTNGGGVYRSTNGGADWEQLTLIGLGNHNITALAILGNYLYAGTESGVFRIDLSSLVTWVSTSSLSANVSALHVFNENLYCGFAANNGVYEFVVGGPLTWQEVGTLGGSAFSLTSDGTYLYAGTASNVYRYDGTWQVVGSGSNPTNVYSLQFVGNYLYAGTQDQGVLRCLSGLNWSQVNNGFRHNDYTVRSLYSSSGKLYAGLAIGGIYNTATDPILWTPIAHTLINKDVRSVIIESDTIYVGTHGDGALKSVDGGANWAFITNEGLEGNLAFNKIKIYGGYLYAAIQNSNPNKNLKAVYRKLVADNSAWELINSGIAGGKCTPNQISCVLTGTNLHVDNGLYLSIRNQITAGPGGGVHKFGGSSWSYIDGLINSGWTSTMESKVGDFWASSYLGEGSSGNGVYRNNNPPTTSNWHKIGAPPSYFQTTNIVSSKYHDGYLYVGADSSSLGTVFKISTSSTGENWEDITYGLSGSANDLCLHNSLIHAALSGSTKGVYSLDVSAWTEIKSEVVDDALALYSHYDVLYAGTRSGILKKIDSGT